MKIFNKLLTVIGAALILSSTMSVFAATTESDIIAYLKSNNVNSSYLTQAENFFKTNDFSDAQLTALKSDIESTVALVKSVNPEALTNPTAANLGKFSEAQKQEVLNSVTKAAGDVNLKVNFTKDASGVTVAEFVDKTTNKVVAKASVLDSGLKITDGQKDSGALLVALGGLLIIVAFAGSYVARKFVRVK